jgi:O-antigen ligase
LLIALLWARTGNLTLVMRQLFYLGVDVLLPFYVAANTLRSVSAFRDVAASFALGVAVLAVVAVFEYARGWLLYGALDEAMGQPWGFGSYLRRGTGALRAIASAGHPIALGYLMMVAIAFMLAVRSVAKPAALWWLGMSSLLAGLLVSISRGPWVGAIAMAVVWFGFSVGSGKRIVRSVSVVAVIICLIMLSPLGRPLIELLPFVGNVDVETVQYREQLFWVSLSVLAQSPLFGVPNYLQAGEMQQLIQGEGIIDMVNTYLAIAMSAGVVGLTLFVGVFVAAAIAVLKARARVADLHAGAEQLGRALLAALAGMAVTIVTTSSISFIPTVYWLLAGLCVAYARAFSAEIIRQAVERTAMAARRGVA